MSEQPPSWAQLVGRLAAVGCRTAQGEIRYRDADTVDDVGQPVEGSNRFWYAAPNRWRVEDERGPLHVQDDEWIHLRDDDGRMQRLPAATTSWHFSFGHPWTLFGTERDRVERFTRGDDFSGPMGPATPVVVAGRPGWEVVLAPPPHKPHPLHVTIDDGTGSVLRLAVPAAGHYAEVVTFEPDVALPESLFSWDGPAATDWVDEHRRDRTQQRWFSRHRLPVPRWWPAGVNYAPGQAIPDTGAFWVDLELPGFPTLGRWYAAGAPPPHWQSRTEQRHVHQWSDGTWQWALAVDEPLSEADLARVVASIPAQ